jgi:DNA-binding NarL/FixJ family response regulator
MHATVTLPASPATSINIEFTGRQEQITQLILRGMPNPVIAENLNIEERTVKAHLNSLYSRLGIPSGGRCKRIRLAVLMSRPERGTAEIRIPAFTPRQHQIIAGVTNGLSNKEIAATLGTTEQVIKNYLRVILDKTGSGSRLELALWAVRSDIRHSREADAA